MKLRLLLVFMLVISSLTLLAQEQTAEEQEAAKVLAEKKQAIRQIQELKIDTQWLIPGDPSQKLGEISFPELTWDKPEIAKTAFADTTIFPRWFDKDLNEVTKPENPGRYTAYIEKNLLNGMKFRRFVTIFAYDNSNGMWWDNVVGAMGRTKIELSYMPFGSVIDEKIWKQQPHISDMYREKMWDFIYGPEGAVMLSSTSEAKPVKTKIAEKQIDSIYTIQQDYNIALKMKVLNLTPKNLELPKTSEKKSKTLRFGKAKEAGFTEEGIEKIRKTCKDWLKNTENGFNVCIARNGIIAFYESFPGKKDEKEFGSKVKLSSKLPTASITKLHAGLLLGQFIDQGLIDLDAPASNYLPDFPKDGDKIFTVRQLMNHTTGLEGHGDFGGMNNAFLETDELIGMEFLNPGVTRIYNGMGIDLTGKIMEAVSGKSIFRLFQENFFMPLGQDNPNIGDLGYGLNCTVMDLARVAQMMLNQGSYGNKVFFSPDTFAKLTPVPVQKFLPNASDNEVYGVGMAISTYGYPQGYQIYTHGSATGTILMADPERDVIICMSRYTPYGYEPYALNFINAVADALVIK